jgi:hypothetical protein
VPWLKTVVLRTIRPVVRQVRASGEPFRAAPIRSGGASGEEGATPRAIDILSRRGVCLLGLPLLSGPLTRSLGAVPRIGRTSE